jgi:regulator of RNase E activity RraA
MMNSALDDTLLGAVRCSDSQGGRIEGYPVTAKIAAVVQPTVPAGTARASQMAFYKAMAAEPKPSIAVVQDLDYPYVIGAYWGEVNTALHKVGGISGVLTNGVMCDLGDMAQGVLIQAERHGAVVIPTELVEKLGGAIAKMQETQKLVVEPARAQGVDLDAIWKAWSALEKSRR